MLKDRGREGEEDSKTAVCSKLGKWLTGQLARGLSILGQQGVTEAFKLFFNEVLEKSKM